jgi:hypothetical protein
MPAEPKTETARKEVPLFLSVLILLCCLGAGGWFVWWYFHSSGDKVVAVLEAPPPGPRQGRAPRQGRPQQRGNNNRNFTEGIRRVTGQRWLARADNLLLCIDEPRRAEPRFGFYLVNPLPPPQQAAMRVRQAPLDDAPAGRALGLSPEQLKALRSLPLESDLKLSAEDLKALNVTAAEVKVFQGLTITSHIPLDAKEEKMLRDELKEYRDARSRAPRVKAEAALVATLRTVAANHKTQAEQMQKRQLDALDALITPERIKQFQKSPQPRPATAHPAHPPASKPTAHPAAP